MDALRKLATRALDRTTSALRGVRQTPWVPIARVEDGPLGQPENTRLTATVLAEAARNFNPSQYTPAVVVGASPGQTSIGPTHMVGEWLDPVGHVSAMEFDGLTLWARLNDIVERNGKGRIEEAISRGRSQRSVAIWMQQPPDGNPGSAGSGAMLRHLALLGGEPPGQFGLPPLTRYIESALGPEIAERSATWPVITRAYDYDDPDSPTEPADPGEETSMTPEELTAAITAAIAPEIERALAPVRTQMTALETASAERATKTDEALTATRTLVTGLQTATAETQIVTRLDAVIAAGKLTPAEKDFELAALRAVAPEIREQRLVSLEARRSQTTPTRRNFVPTTEAGSEGLYIPDGMETALEANLVSARSMDALQEIYKAVGAPPAAGAPEAERSAYSAKLTGLANSRALGIPDWLQGGGN